MLSLQYLLRNETRRAGTRFPEYSSMRCDLFAVAEHLVPLRVRLMRVLTEDRSENGGFCDEVVEVVVEVMVDPQGQIDHFRHLGDNFCAAAEPREKVTNVAVVLFDGKGQVFSGEELALGDETVIAFPVIGDEGLAFNADFVEEFGMWRHHGDQEPRQWFAE